MCDVGVGGWVVQLAVLFLPYPFLVYFVEMTKLVDLVVPPTLSFR